MHNNCEKQWLLYIGVVILNATILLELSPFCLGPQNIKILIIVLGGFTNIKYYHTHTHHISKLIQIRSFRIFIACILKHVVGS